MMDHNHLHQQQHPNNDAENGTIGSSSIGINATSSSSSSSSLSCSPNCLFSCGGRTSLPSLLSNSRKHHHNTFIPSIPKWTTTIEETEKLIENDFQSFTPTEREQIFHDLNGTGQVVTTLYDEKPTFLASRLEELEYELKQISYHTAYEQAEKLSPEYVHDIQFRLMFLRSELFHARNAAHRMVRFMEEKLAIFGPELLVKEHITWDDLHEDDHKVLLSGVMQATTGRDRAGRHIMVGVPQLLPNPCSSFSLRRAHFYQLMILAREVDAQRRGVVGILYLVDFPSSLVAGHRHELWDVTRLRAACPLRFCAQHMCTDNQQLKSLLSFGMIIMGSHARARHRDHLGTHIEIHYKLMSFGIPSKAIPVDPSGVYRPGSYFQWIATQRDLEMASCGSGTAGVGDSTTSPIAITNGHPELSAMQQSSPSPELQALILANASMDLEPIPLQYMTMTDTFTPGVFHEGQHDDNEVFPAAAAAAAITSTTATNTPLLEPGRFDVVFGRGKGPQGRPGNARFRLVVEMHREKYERANKAGKTEIGKETIRIIKESSGRFLKQIDGGGWEEVDDGTVRSKVSHAFRARRAEAQQRQQVLTNQSSSLSTSSTTTTTEPAERNTKSGGGGLNNKTPSPNPIDTGNNEGEG